MAADSSFEPGTPKHLFASGISTPDARFAVTADGVQATVPAAKSVSLNRLYFFS